MSTIVVAAQFTESGGQPSTGLTLADIDLYLTRIDNSTGAVTVVWDGTQNPTVEITNCGSYARLYATADLETYTYFASAHYTGAPTLDSDYASGAVALAESTILPAGIDAIFDEAMAGHSGAGTVGAEIQSHATPAEVNAQALDVLTVDTFAQPGQESPAAIQTLASALLYLYKAFRNKVTQTSTELNIYADDGVTVDQRADVSDDGVTYTRDELESGP